MKRITFIVLLLLFTGCASKVTTQKEALHHVVLVWFETNTTSQQKEELFEASKRLASFEEVKHLHIGRTLSKDTSLNDTSFDLGLTFEFKDLKSLKAYLADPSHKTFIQDHMRGNVKKVVVYDY